MKIKQILKVPCFIPKGKFLCPQQLLFGYSHPALHVRQTCTKVYIHRCTCLKCTHLRVITIQKGFISAIPWTAGICFTGNFVYSCSWHMLLPLSFYYFSLFLYHRHYTRFLQTFHFISHIKYCQSNLLFFMNRVTWIKH